MEKMWKSVHALPFDEVYFTDRLESAAGAATTVGKPPAAGFNGPTMSELKTCSSTSTPQDNPK